MSTARVEDVCKLLDNGCPEPVTPIEWTELEPWLWHTKGAAIAMSGNGICAAVVAGKMSCNYFATLADAKYYAEPHIRKGTP